MGKYTIAARHAAAAVEQHLEIMPCTNPQNNLIHQFLLEVRRMKLAEATPADSTTVLDNTFVISLKKAADSIVNHPYRVYDTQTAQEVNGIGPTIARVIQEDLFADFPPDPPTEEELRQIQRTKEALKLNAAVKRKRRAEAIQNPPHLAPSSSRPFLSPTAPVTLGGLAASANTNNGTSTLGALGLGTTNGTAANTNHNGRIAGAGTTTAAAGVRGNYEADLIMGGSNEPRTIPDGYGGMGYSLDEDEDPEYDLDLIDARLGRGRGRGKGRGRGRSSTAAGAAKKPKEPKPPKEYIPSIGAANYAFLIVLFQAQKGPDQKEFLLKADLMNLAEASGLSDKPIHPDEAGAAATGAARGAGGGRGFSFGGFNPKAFYSGWSNFKRLETANLAYSFSNPKKISLTPKGVALAERMYRDAVDSGKAAAVPGLATNGPFQYQVPETAPPPTALPNNLINLNGRGPGGRGTALPSVQVRPSAGVGGNLTPPLGFDINLPNYGGSSAYLGATGAGSGGRRNSGSAAQKQRTAAAAAAENRRGSGMGGGSQPTPSQPSQPSQDELNVPLAVRLGVQHNLGLGPSSFVQQQPLQQRQRQQQQRQEEVEVIDLLDDSEDEEPAGFNQTLNPRRSIGDGIGGNGNVATPDVRAVLDEQVAMLVEMGYSDRRARKALGMSVGVEDALDTIDLLSSDEEDEDANPPQQAQQQLQQPSLPGDLPKRPAASNPAPKPRDTNMTTNKNNYLLLDGNGCAPAPAAVAPAVGHIRGGINHHESRIRIGSQSQSQQQYMAEPSLSAGGAAAPSDSWQQRQRGFATVARLQADAESLPRAGAAAAAAQVGGVALLNNQNRNNGIVDDDLDLDGDGDVDVVQPSEVAQVRLPPLTPGRPFTDKYQVVLLVDGREQYSRRTGAGAAHEGRGSALEAHLERMRIAGMPVEQRTLPIGDALWIARSKSNPAEEYVLDYILERKSLHDLLSSIKSSNRYNSQKYFLKKSGVRYLYYLIEGDPDTLPTPQDQKVVRSAAATTEINDGFRVLRTMSHQETFRLYQTLTDAITAVYAEQTASINASSTADRGSGLMRFEAWKDHMKFVDKGGTTLHDSWGCMLTEVQGLGPEAVTVILKRYPTPASLYKAYRSTIVQAQRTGKSCRVAGEEMLAGLMNFRTGRTIGVEKARKVFRQLYASNWDVVVS